MDECTGSTSPGTTPSACGLTSVLGLKGAVERLVGGDDGQGGQWEVIGHLADDDPDLLVVTRAQRKDYSYGMTDEEVEATTERVSQQLRNLHRGGYSLSGGEEHSPKVSVTLPREVRDKVAARAAAEGVSVSKYLRRIITEHAA